MLGGHSAPTRSDDLPGCWPLAWSRFVGRDGELGRLGGLLARAVGGQGGTVFLLGDQGVGKTRFAREVLLQARRNGFSVLAGCAYPLEVGLPYAPVIEAFRPYLRRLGPEQQGALRRELPALGRLFAELPAPPAPSPSDSELDRLHLFEAFDRLVEILAREAPVFLFLDDLHWADPASIALLHYLARRLPERRALLLGAYRPVEGRESQALRLLVASAKHAGFGETIALSRLVPDDVADLTASLLGGPAPADLLALLEARAAGIPLFLEELIHTLIAEGHLVRAGDHWTVVASAREVLPPELRQLILARLDLLPPADRRIVELIAAYGDVVPLPLLQEAAARANLELLDGVSRLQAAGLIAEKPGEATVGFHCAHPLIQEVAHREMTELARRHAHGLFIATLDRLSPDDLDQLAYHYLYAAPSDPIKALDVLLSAGERWWAIHADHRAARYFSRAVRLIRDGVRPELLSATLERLGEVCERTGDLAAAVSLWTETLAGCEARGEVAKSRRLYHHLALAEWEQGHVARALEHLRSGVALAPDADATPELADLYDTQVCLLAAIGDAGQAALAASALAEVARRLGSRRADAQAQLGSLEIGVGNRGLSVEHDEVSRSLASAAAANEDSLICRARVLAMVAAPGQGHGRAARDHAARLLEADGPDRVTSVKLTAQIGLALADFQAGEWDAALRRAAETLEQAQRVGARPGIVGALELRGLIHALRGDLDEARVCLDRARLLVSSPPLAIRWLVGGIALLEAAIAWETGEADKVRGRAAELTTLPMPLLPIGLSLVAEAQLARRELNRARATAAQLGQLAADRDSWPGALALWIEGLVQCSRGHHEAAREKIERATSSLLKLELPFEAARASLARATIARAWDRDATSRAARTSLAAFEAVGARGYARRAQEILEALPAIPSSVVAPTVRPRHVELSPRELDVACLIAEGLTNPEIAGRLFLSHRTIDTHVQHIYARLGISSRSMLTRYVVSEGLLDPPNETAVR